MPFVSESQRRKFYAMKERGEVSAKVVKEFEKGSPEDLPERVKTAAYCEAYGLELLKGAAPRWKQLLRGKEI